MSEGHLHFEVQSALRRRMQQQSVGNVAKTIGFLVACLRCGVETMITCGLRILHDLRTIPFVDVV